MLKILCEYIGVKRDVVFWFKDYVCMGMVDGFRRSFKEQLFGGRVIIIDIIIKVIMEFLDLGNYMCFIFNSIFSEIIMVYVSEYYKIENLMMYVIVY